MKTQTIFPTSPALEAAERTAVEAKPMAAARLLFIDNIRVFLTVLVLLHHLMITYAGSGSWIYTEGRQDIITESIGTWFCFVNQAYFMGLFLLISAYFVPGSYDRKGAGRFLKDRLVRLGIPLAIYSWVIHPILIYAYLTWTEGLHSSLRSFYTGLYFTGGELIGAGPIWFIETLLIFSFVYVAWRLGFRNRPADPSKEHQFPSSWVIATFSLFLGIAGFLVRLGFPIDWKFTPLNLQFPFFAQYIALFILGLVAYRRDWLLGLPDKTGRRWLVFGILLILAFPPLALSLGISEENVALFKGGLHLQALFMALYEAFLCLSLCIGLVYAFRRYANGRSRLGNFLVPNAYTAYLIHAPLLVVVALVLRPLDLYPLLKFVLAALVTVPATFALSSLVRKLPYTQRVL
jgi:glucan biosynthesis protein C